MTLYTYTPSAESDLLLAQLWARMHESNDLDALFSDPAFPLSAMIAASSAPNELVYATDDSGIWLAMWFNRIMRGAFLSAWVRADMRGTFRATITYKRVLDAGMKTYGTLLGLTRHEHLLPVHRALGYTLVGVVPGIFPGGEDGYLLSKTPTEKEHARWHGSVAPSAEAAARH